MLTRRAVHLARTSYALRIAGARFYNPEQKGDVGHQANQAGFAARDAEKATPLDAASPEGGKKASRGDLTGNEENIGFADQVGSQSASASQMGKPQSTEGIAGQDEITPPAFADVVKKKLGFKTTAGEDKQNRGSGKGVTGTGSLAFDRGKRTMYSCAAWMTDAASATRGQAPEASRQPQDKTIGDQNAHLKHKSDPSKPDSGKGNAAENPGLPSQHVDTSWESPNPSQQKRGFYTSAWAHQERDTVEHTAETYFKDIDTTKPTNPKVHKVDPSTGGAPVARANEEPVSGDFSRAGPQTKEYETKQVSKHDKPYDIPPIRGPEAEKKLRYGGQPGLESPADAEEGPTGASQGGRKPEGR